LQALAVTSALQSANPSFVYAGRSAPKPKTSSTALRPSLVDWKEFRERPCFPARFPGFGLCAIQDKIQRFKLKDWEPLAYRDVSPEQYLRSCTGLKHLNIRVAANRYRASPSWQNVSESNVLEKEGDQLQNLAQIRGLESLTLVWSSNSLGEGQELERRLMKLMMSAKDGSRAVVSGSLGRYTSDW